MPYLWCYMLIVNAICLRLMILKTQLGPCRVHIFVHNFFQKSLFLREANTFKRFSVVWLISTSRFHRFESAHPRRSLRSQRHWCCTWRRLSWMLGTSGRKHIGKSYGNPKAAATNFTHVGDKCGVLFWLGKKSACSFWYFLEVHVWCLQICWICG